MSKINLAAQKRAQNNSSKALLFGAVFGIITFATGIGIGSGRINIVNSAPYDSVASELPSDLNYSTVEDLYDSLRVNYDGDLTEQELIDGLKEGLAQATGDPYTEYLNPEAAESFNEDLSGTFSGIGAELGKEEDAIIIVAPLDGFPAQKAGLRAKDIVTKIDGESAFGLTITEAVNTIRGPIDTDVTLTVVRNNTQELEITITRAQIKIPSAEYEIKEFDGKQIGYLKISRFADDTYNIAQEAANDFKQQNVNGVVLDMRSNPGGLLNAAVDLSSLWLQKGATVLEEKRAGITVKSYTANGGDILAGMPTIVLVNEGSASASEITAGALRDNNAATLLGTKTFGKGSVQSLVNLGDQSILKVTIARWFTPSGVNIDKEGLEPDQKVEFTDEDYENEKDPQLEAALKAL